MYVLYVLCEDNEKNQKIAKQNNPSFYRVVTEREININFKHTGVGDGVGAIDGASVGSNVGNGT